MTKNICIYPNFRILGEFKVTTFGEKQEKRVSFAVSSYLPDSNSVYLKLYCHAFDKVAEDLIKASLKDGDLITIICEHGLFKTKTGIMESRYKVTGFNYVKRSSKEENKEENNINDFMGTLHALFP